MTDAAITQRATVETIVRVYTEAESEIVRACGVVARAMERLNTSLGAVGFAREIEFGRLRHGYRFEFEAPDDQIHALRRQLWSLVVDRLELRRMMSVARATELDKWLETTTEAVTMESVLGLFRMYAEQLPDMLAEAVGEVYEFLRPRNSRLVTNSQYELGVKVIVHGWVELGICRGLRPSYYYYDQYRALENVFSALDGRGSITKSYRGELADAVEAATADSDYRGETTYFRFRACKNGNLHLEFKRADLVDKFNRIAGGRRLKHDTTARSERDAAE